MCSIKERDGYIAGNTSDEGAAITLWGCTTFLFTEFNKDLKKKEKKRDIMIYYVIISVEQGIISQAEINILNLDGRERKRDLL